MVITLFRSGYSAAQNMPGRLIKIVPNVLSSFRLALALAFPLLPSGWRLPALVVGALSDWIDGLIARRYHATSVPGALLDAIADKLFTLSVLITIVMGDNARWWQALIVLSRDLAVTAIAVYALLIGRYDAFQHMRPRLPGKLTTTLVLLWMVALLAGAPIAVLWKLFALAGAMSVLARAHYLMQFVQRLPEMRAKTDENGER